MTGTATRDGLRAALALAVAVARDASDELSLEALGRRGRNRIGWRLRTAERALREALELLGEVRPC